MAQAKEEIRKLIGEIRLVPTADGYLEAVLTGLYAGCSSWQWWLS
jgi:hypothetical protein